MEELNTRTGRQTSTQPFTTTKSGRHLWKKKEKKRLCALGAEKERKNQEKDVGREGDWTLKGDQQEKNDER